MRQTALFRRARSAGGGRAGGDEATPDGNARGRLGRVLQRLAAAGLVAFHGFLLWDRIASLTLLAPAVALRWAGTLMLLLGLSRMSRAGVPLCSGRRARVIWTLVALLHASMVPGTVSGLATLSETTPELWLTLALSSLIVALGASAGSASMILRVDRPRHPEYAPSAVRSSCLPLLAARPPPVF